MPVQEPEVPFSIFPLVWREVVDDVTAEVREDPLKHAAQGSPSDLKSKGIPILLIHTLGDSIIPTFEDFCWKDNLIFFVLFENSTIS